MLDGWGWRLLEARGADVLSTDRQPDLYIGSKPNNNTFEQKQEARLLRLIQDKPGHVQTHRQTDRQGSRF